MCACACRGARARSREKREALGSEPSSAQPARGHGHRDGDGDLDAETVTETTETSPPCPWSRSPARRRRTPTPVGHLSWQLPARAPKCKWALPDPSLSLVGGPSRCWRWRWRRQGPALRVASRPVQPSQGPASGPPAGVEGERSCARVRVRGPVDPAGGVGGSGLCVSACLPLCPSVRDRSFARPALAPSCPSLCLWLSLSSPQSWARAVGSGEGAQAPLSDPGPPLDWRV